MAALPGIIEIIIDGIVYDLVKHGAEWVIRGATAKPPPIGKRPPVLWANGVQFHLQPNGNYMAEQFRIE
jgi:hypothetical protein